LEDEVVKIVKGDTVKVIAGADRGKVGKVLKVFPDKNRVIIEKVRLIKRHTRPSQKLPQGGVIEREASVDVSNVMLVDPKTGEPTRVGITRRSDGTKDRVARKSGEIVARPEE
jgi:large subunit ribosomal protein L24